MFTMTAPVAWRAISPVSRISRWRPQISDFLTWFKVRPLKKKRPRFAVEINWTGGERPAGDTPPAYPTVHMRRKASAMLLAQPETIDQPTVFVDVRALEIIEELAPAAHHPQQPAPRMVILDVRLEMLGKVRNARRQQRDLNLGRSGITRGALVILNQLGL